MVAAELDSFAAAVHFSLPFSAYLSLCLKGEWSGVRSGNTVVSFWSLSLFWCGIEVWFFVSMSVAVRADTAMFFFLCIIEQFFCSNGLP